LSRRAGVTPAPCARPRASPPARAYRQTNGNLKPDAIGADDLMHATVHQRPFNAEGWTFELKLDGFRALVRRQNGRVTLISRRGRPMADLSARTLAKEGE